MTQLTNEDVQRVIRSMDGSENVEIREYLNRLVLEGKIRSFTIAGTDVTIVPHRASDQINITQLDSREYGETI